MSGGFWAARQEANRRVSEVAGFDNLRQSGLSGTWNWWRRAAQHGCGGASCSPIPTSINGWKRSAGNSAAMAAEEAQVLHRMADNAITVIERAQAPDGYLDSWFQLNAPQQRFTDLAASHELYCAGHLLQAGVAWHESLDDDRRCG